MTTIITVILILITLAIIVTGSIRHGWSNFYLVALGLIVVAGLFMVLSMTKT